VVLLLGGCTNAPPPTRERSEFAIAADKICANLTDAVAPVRDKATRAVKRDELDDAARYAREAAASGTVFLDQLAKLEPPPDDRAGVARWIAQLRAQQSKTTELADAIADRDPALATKLNEEIRGLAKKTRRYAFDFGMQTCSK
jgi:hypothetical protein